MKDGIGCREREEEREKKEEKKKFEARRREGKNKKEAKPEKNLKSTLDRSQTSLAEFFRSPSKKLRQKKRTPQKGTHRLPFGRSTLRFFPVGLMVSIFFLASSIFIFVFAFVFFVLQVPWIHFSHTHCSCQTLYLRVYCPPPTFSNSMVFLELLSVHLKSFR
jgi:hypothetical protein